MLCFLPGQLAAREIPPYGMPLVAVHRITDLPLEYSRQYSPSSRRLLETWFVQKEHLSNLTAGIFGIATNRSLPAQDLPEAPLLRASLVLPESHLTSGSLPGSDWL
jgi:hypothetical protein